MGSSWVLGEGESFFFKGVAPSRLPMLQSMAPQQCFYEHQLDLMNAFFLNDMNWEGEVLKMIQEEVEGDSRDDMIKIYSIHV